MKKSMRAISAAPAAMFVNPKTAAIRAIMRNANDQRSMMLGLDYDECIVFFHFRIYFLLILCLEKNRQKRILRVYDKSDAPLCFFAGCIFVFSAFSVFFNSH